MPLYATRTYDVWGNAAEGYEVNNSFSGPEVYIPPVETDREFIQIAVEEGVLGSNALVLFDNAQLALEDEDEGEARVVVTLEVEIGVARRDGHRWLDVHGTVAEIQARAIEDELLRAGEDVGDIEEVAGWRPTVGFYEAELDGDGGPDEDGVQFWSVSITYPQDASEDYARRIGPCGACQPPGILQNMDNGTTVGTERCDTCDTYPTDEAARIALLKINGYDLLIELGYYRDTERIGVEVVVGNMLRPHTSDRFEWPLAEWQRNPTFGFDPMTREELTPTPKQLEAILVSLDSFMERTS